MDTRVTPAPQAAETTTVSAEARRVMGAIARIANPTADLSDCLTYVGQGLSWQEIAREMDCSLSHVERVFQTICLMADINERPVRERELIVRDGYLARKKALEASSSAASASSHQTERSGNRNAEIERIAAIIERLPDRHFSLLTKSCAGENAGDIAAKQRVPVRDILTTLGIVYEKFGFSRAPSPHQVGLVRDALAMTTRKVEPEKDEEKPAEKTPAPPVARAAETARAEPIPQKPQSPPKPTLASSEASGGNGAFGGYSKEALEKLIDTIASRIRTISPRQREVLAHMAKGLRGEALMEAAGYGTLASSDNAAATIRGMLGVPPGRSIRPEERTEILRRALELYRSNTQATAQGKKDEPADTGRVAQPPLSSPDPPESERQEAKPAPDKQPPEPEPENPLVERTSKVHTALPVPEEIVAVRSLPANVLNFEAHQRDLVAQGYRAEIIQTDLFLNSGKTNVRFIFVKRTH